MWLGEILVDGTYIIYIDGRLQSKKASQSLECHKISFAPSFTMAKFVSPFAASRILEQRIYEPTNRRTTRPRDVKNRKVIKLKFLSMLFLYYIKSRQVSIRLDTA